MSNRPQPARRDTPATPSPSGDERPESASAWDETLKRVVVNVGAALVTIVVVLGLCIAVVLLLIKLGVWAMT